jgi:hypothetical protein
MINKDTIVKNKNALQIIGIYILETLQNYLVATVDKKQIENIIYLGLIE